MPVSFFRIVSAVQFSHSLSEHFLEGGVLKPISDSPQWDGIKVEIFILVIEDSSYPKKNYLD